MVLTLPSSPPPSAALPTETLILNRFRIKCSPPGCLYQPPHPEFQAGWYLSGPDFLTTQDRNLTDCTIPGSWTIDGVSGVNCGSVESIPLDNPPDGEGAVTPGQYVIGGIVDTRGDIDESDEFNNVYLPNQFGTLVVSNDVDRPDLETSNLTFPASVAVGASGSSWADVGNVEVTSAGVTLNANAPDVDPLTHVGFYLSFDLGAVAAIPSQDRYLGSCAIDEALVIRATPKSCSTSLTMPEDLTPGTRKLVAFADDLGLLPEFDEANNHVARDLTLDPDPAISAAPQPQDHGFETSVLTNWALEGAATPELSSDYAYHGSQSLKLTGRRGGRVAVCDRTGGRDRVPCAGESSGGEGNVGGSQATGGQSGDR